MSLARPRPRRAGGRLLLTAALALAGSAARGEPTAPAADPAIENPASPTASPPVDGTEPSAAPDATCTLEPDQEFIGLDWARRTAYEGVCVTARWIDRLFGDEEFDPVRYPIEGFVGLNYEQRQHGSPAIKPKLRLRLKLPNLSRKVDLFFERDDENKTIVGESDSAVTRQLGSGEQATPQLGLGYEFLRSIDRLLTFRVGIRLVDGKPDPFVRSRYNLRFARRESAEWRFGETLFYRHLEGFGETTTLDYERRLGGPFIFQWSSSATLSQVTEAFRWGSSATVLHPLDDRRTLLYSLSAGGETGKPVPVGNFGPRLAYRQRLDRKWLFGEVYVGVDRPKSEPAATRGEVPYVGAKIEAHFQAR